MHWILLDLHGIRVALLLGYVDHRLEFAIEVEEYLVFEVEVLAPLAPLKQALAEHLGSPFAARRSLGARLIRQIVIYASLRLSVDVSTDIFDVNAAHRMERPVVFD